MDEFMKLAAAIIVSLTCALGAVEAMAEKAYSAPSKVYKWTDDKGQVHYAEHAPTNATAKVIKPETGHSDPVNYPTAASSSSAGDSDAKPTTKTAFKDKDRCEVARKNAETLKTYTHIKFKEANGEYRYLSPEEQKQKLDEANKAVEESCE